jgi:hypothetical protein
MEFKILRLKLQLSFIYKVPKNKRKRREIGMPVARAAPYSPKSSNFINTKSSAIFTSADNQTPLQGGLSLCPNNSISHHAKGKEWH